MYHKQYDPQTVVRQFFLGSKMYKEQLNKKWQNVQVLYWSIHNFTRLPINFIEYLNVEKDKSGK